MKLKFKVQSSKFKVNKGFTLVEVAVITGIMATLLGFITINLVGSQQKADLTAHEQVLISDLKSQQIKAITGDTEGRNVSSSYGIHFEQNKYILFHGNVFSSVESSNSEISLDSNMQFNNPGFDVIFSKLSGEIAAPLIIELQDNTNSSLRRIHINNIGVVTQVESL